MTGALVSYLLYNKDTKHDALTWLSKTCLYFRAAFQYGVKMSDGRKTRRAGPKDEKAELDRQWQKIQNIIHKRKGPDERNDYKKPKY